MNIYEAYIKVKTQNDGFLRNVLYQCLDLDNAWAFAFSESPVPKNCSLVGVVYDVINKSTAKITKKAAFEYASEILKGKNLDVGIFDNTKSEPYSTENNSLTQKQAKAMRKELQTNTKALIEEYNQLRKSLKGKTLTEKEQIDLGEKYVATFKSATISNFMNGVICRNFADNEYTNVIMQEYISDWFERTGSEKMYLYFDN
ncbi:hypothetical protein FACS1894132_11200 [Clostridia bacterium]|nr:hypothetical protein FACS1894132_11200 [Clostridia bacterium]